MEGVEAWSWILEGRERPDGSGWGLGDGLKIETRGDRRGEGDGRWMDGVPGGTLGEAAEELRRAGGLAPRGGRTGVDSLREGDATRREPGRARTQEAELAWLAGIYEANGEMKRRMV